MYISTLEYWTMKNSLPHIHQDYQSHLLLMPESSSHLNLLVCVCVYTYRIKYNFICSYNTMSSHKIQQSHITQQSFPSGHIRHAFYSTNRHTKLCKEWYLPSATNADGNKSPAARNSSNLNIRAGNLHTTYKHL